MSEKNKLLFRDKCFGVGFMGDFLLQLIVDYRGDLAGLKKYFEQHGKLESMFIAGGMMYCFGYIFELSEFEKNYQNLFFYGGLLDIIFRQYGLFESLNDSYYKELNSFQSFIWGGIPMILPKLITDII